MKIEWKDDELTTCHVIARNSSNRTNRGGGFIDIVAHAHAGAIALRDIVDEEIGEGSMSVSYLGSSRGQQHGAKAGEMHVWILKALTARARSTSNLLLRMDEINEQINAEVMNVY